MRAKVQFINGDLTGATETYRTIETRFSDNLEAKKYAEKNFPDETTGKLFGIFKNKTRNARGN